jgi:hypothetical protein
MEGRALSPDMVFRDSEEPGCSGGVLPDESIGLSPGTLARKLSRCKLACRQAGRVWRVFLPSWYKFNCVLARSRYNYDRSRVPIAIGIITGYKVGCGHWRSVAVQSQIEARRLSRYTGFKLRAVARVRVQ